MSIIIHGIMTTAVKVWWIIIEISNCLPLHQQIRKLKNIGEDLANDTLMTDKDIFHMYCSEKSILLTVLQTVRETSVLNPVVSLVIEGAGIHLNLVAMCLTQTTHFDRQRASSLLKPTFVHYSLNCFLHVVFYLPSSFDFQPEIHTPFSRHDYEIKVKKIKRKNLSRNQTYLPIINIQRIAVHIHILQQ